MSESAHRIRISEGNRKMGAIPSVSLPAVRTCDPSAPCTRGACYVVANMYGGPWGENILASHRANLEFLLYDRDLYHDAINEWLDRKRPELFRFHVSGDFIDRDHLAWTIELCSSQPETRFLVFTKRHSWLPRRSTLPPNLSIVASMWSGWGTRPKGYRAAWCDDGAETRIPKSALQCPGGCESCGMCWDIYRLKRDVYFKAH